MKYLRQQLAKFRKNNSGRIDLRRGLSWYLFAAVVGIVLTPVVFAHDGTSPSITSVTASPSSARRDLGDTVTVSFSWTDNNSENYDINIKIRKPDDATEVNLVVDNVAQSNTSNWQAPGSTSPYTASIDLTLNGTFDTGYWDLHADVTDTEHGLSDTDSYAANPDELLVNGTFNDAATGNWNIGTTWGGACGAACAEHKDYPGSGDWVTIDSHTVTLTTDGTAGTITLATGGVFAAGSNNFTVTGTFWENTGGSFTNSGGQVMFTSTTNATITSNGNAFNDVVIDDGGDIADLIAYWNMDETAENTCDGGVNDVCDSGPNGYDGAFNNSAVFSSTVAPLNFSNERSIDFSAASQSSVNTVDINEIDGASQLSIAVWAKVNDINTNYPLMGKGTSGSNVSVHIARKETAAISARTDTFETLVTDGTTYRGEGATNSWNDTDWHHIAMTYQGGSVTGLRFYMDGVEDANSPVDTTSIPTIGSDSNVFQFGDDVGGSAGLDGLMDDLRIYSRILTSSEIARLAAGNNIDIPLATFTLQDALDVNGTLLIVSGTLDVSGANYDINVAGNWLNQGGGFVSRAGNVTMDGLTGTLTIQEPGAFYDLTLDESATNSVAWEVSGTLDVDGNLLITDGTLDVTGSLWPVEVAGDWTLAATGSFNAQTGTVYLDGADQAITGDTTFYNFVKEDVISNSTDETLTFDAGSVTTIQGSLTLNGIDSANRVNLISSSAGSRFELDVPGSNQTVSWVDVKDSEASSNDITASDGINSGGNDNGEASPHWVLGAPATVRVWDGEGADGTCGGGGGDGNKWSCALNWSGDTVPTVADTARFNATSTKAATIDTDVEVVWLDIDTGYSGTITQGSGNTVTVNGTFSQADGTVTGGDALFDVNGTFETSSNFAMTSGTLGVGGNFTLQSGAVFTNPDGTLSLDANLTFTDSTAGGTNVGRVHIAGVTQSTDLATDLIAISLTVTSGNTINTNGYDLDVSGTITVNGVFDATDDVETDETTINAGGSFIVNAGATFTADQSTLIMDGTVGTYDLITDGNYPLYNLTVDSAAAGALTIEVEDPLDVNGSLLITDGTLDVVSGENNAITLAGNWSFGGTGSFVAQTGTVTFDGGDQTVTGDTSFYNFAKSDPTDDGTDVTLTIASGSTQTIDGTLTLEGIDDEDRVNIVSSTGGSRHTWDVTLGDQTVNWVDVTDSQASSNDIVGFNTLDTDNNDTGEGTPNWIINLSLTGQTTFYLHAPDADSSGTNAGSHNIMSLTPPINTARNGTGAETVPSYTGAPPCEADGTSGGAGGASVTDTIEDIVIETDDGQNTTAIECLATYYGPPMGQSISLLTSDADSLSFTYYYTTTNSSNATENVKAEFYKFTEPSTYTLIGTLTDTTDLAASVDDEMRTVTGTPSSTVTFSADDRLVVVLLLDLSVMDTSGAQDHVRIHMDDDPDAATKVVINYTMISPNKPDLTGTMDDDFTTTAATTSCTAGGVSYNSQWTCLQPNGTGEFNANTDASDWLWLNNTSATAGENFGATPDNTYLYQTLPGGNAVITTVVNSPTAPEGSSPFPHAGLLLWTSDTDYLEVQVHDNGTNKVVAVNDDDTLVSTTTLSSDWGRVWLRWTRIGNNHTASYSLDGSTFTAVGSAISHPTAFTRTGLNTFSGEASRLYSGAFEFFNVDFPPAVEISGTLYSDEGVTEITTQPAVTANVPSVGTFGTTAAADGSYAISNMVMTAGEVVSVFIDNDSADANAVTLASGGTIADMDLYQNRFIIRNDQGGAALTEAELDVFDNEDDDDMLFIIRNGNTLNAESGSEMWIKSSETFEFTTDGTLGAVDINGTLTMGSHNIIVTGSFDASGGMFSSSGQVLFDVTSNINVASSSNAFNDVVINRGLLGYWKMDEASGSTAYDFSGRNRDATYQGNAVSDTNAAPVKFNNRRSIELDGTGDYLLVDPTFNETFNFEWTDVFSIFAWVNVRDFTNSRYIFSKREDGGGGRGYNLQISPSQVVSSRLQNNSAGSSLIQVDSTNTLSGNTWYHVGLTYDGSTVAAGVKIYINGVEETPNVVTDNLGGNFTTSENVNIGSIGGSATTMDGFIDNVRVYNRVLSDAEIALLGKGIPPGTSLGTVTLGDNLDVDGTLMINEGTLDVSAGDYDINVAGNWLNHGGDFWGRAGNVTMDGVTGTLTLQEHGTFNNLTLDESASNSVAWEVSGTLDVDNNLLITDGTLDVTGSLWPIEVAGNWTMGATGSFAAQTGTVYFDGGDQSLTGDTTFYNFFKEDDVSDATDEILTFEASSVTTFLGTLTIDGMDADNRVNLRSSVADTRFELDVRDGDQTVSWVDVKDSESSSNDITATNVLNSGGNDDGEASPHWVLPAGPAGGPLKGAIIFVD